MPSTSPKRQSAVALGVLVDKDGVRSAGGYMITPFPDASEEEISKVEQSIFKAGAISKMLDKDMSLEEIAKKVTGDEDIEILESNIEPRYECDCSKERMKEVLISLGKEDIEEMLKEQGKIEIECHFCNKKYSFQESDFKNI